MKKEIDHATEALRLARERIADGWCRGRARKIIRGKPHYCIFGAIARDYGFYRRFDIYYVITDTIQRRLCDAIGLKCAPGNDVAAAIAAWNDDPKRTKRQVLAAFDRAINESTTRDG